MSCPHPYNVAELLLDGGDGVVVVNRDRLRVITTLPQLGELRRKPGELEAEVTLRARLAWRCAACGSWLALPGKPELPAWAEAGLRAGAGLEPVLPAAWDHEQLARLRERLGPHPFAQEVQGEPFDPDTQATLHDLGHRDERKPLRLCSCPPDEPRTVATCHQLPLCLAQGWREQHPDDDPRLGDSGGPP